MKKLDVSILLLLMHAQLWTSTGQAEPVVTQAIGLKSGDQSHVINIHATIDGESFNTYWDQVFDDLFNFADINFDGWITDDEIHLLPSSRSLHLARSSGFAPPVANLRAAGEVRGEKTRRGCTRDDVREYYRESGVGTIAMGWGNLPGTNALSDALIEVLDSNHDGVLSRTELSNAEFALRKFDTNDDELIAATELLPEQAYPGCSATNHVPLASMSTWRDPSLPLLAVCRLSPLGEQRDPIPKERDNSLSLGPITHLEWNLAITNVITDNGGSTPSSGRLVCDVWAVKGSLPDQFTEFSQQIRGATVWRNDLTSSVGPNRPSSTDLTGQEFSWLVPLVDRNRDGAASTEEITAWLDLQEKIARGQLLISVLTGGGLFERLDQNRDAALSIRELRGAWDTLEANWCTSGNHIDREKSANFILVVACQGYPTDVRKTIALPLDWFRQMDRNFDGDISRREFTEPIGYFSQLDLDGDDLISPAEAESALIAR